MREQSKQHATFDVAISLKRLHDLFKTYQLFFCYCLREQVKTRKKQPTNNKNWSKYGYFI